MQAAIAETRCQATKMDPTVNPKGVTATGMRPGVARWARRSIKLKIVPMWAWLDRWTVRVYGTPGLATSRVGSGRCTGGFGGRPWKGTDLTQRRGL
ncbi:hypothetical protein LYSHEL_26410 [Lysobacter helvus]|uniref:Uncharacterized protein n=2 Tax=Lysobacteraceae TaxID=32033 RepID=A0ABN6FVY1_9GAMM|nr:hypothetical protein LYSCAS_26400 [Lysobacter caseinilyticus]BCT96770.1 hypothetical protein LYSHEL_26410 [Lysobacter helvus]